jgi:hypothetical protein
MRLFILSVTAMAGRRPTLWGFVYRAVPASLRPPVPERTPRPLLRALAIDSCHRRHEITPCLCRRSKQFMVPPDQIIGPGIVHSVDVPTFKVALGSIGWNRGQVPVRVIGSARLTLVHPGHGIGQGRNRHQTNDSSLLTDRRQRIDAELLVGVTVALASGAKTPRYADPAAAPLAYDH